MGIGIPISQLPEITVPFTGSEELAIVQDNITQSAPLSSLLNYLQPQLGVSYLLNNATNWQNTYLTVSTKDVIWSNTAFTVSTLSANWQTTYSTVNSLSSTWDADFCDEVVKINRAEACGNDNILKLDGNLRVENGWIGLSGADYGYGFITGNKTSGGIGLAGTFANATGENGADFYVDNGGRSFTRNNLSVKTTDTTDSLVVGSGNIRVKDGHLRISSGSLSNDWGFIGQGSDSSGIGLAASSANLESTEFLPHLYVAGLGSSLGNVGINTTVAEPPMEKLDVRGNLQVGLSGADANLIKFYGTFGDGLGTGGLNPIGTHTVIGERRYDKQTKEEASELILFKGDNPDETYGPDRVRARAAEIVFQTFESPDRETYDTMLDNNTRLIIKNDGKVGIGTDTPTADLEVSGQIKVTGGSPGTNKILISDASGLASWSDAAAVTSVVVSDVAPLSPSNGDLWFNSLEANMYVFYVEGAQGYWVEANSHAILPASIDNWNEAYSWGDHSTQSYATSGYVDNKVADLVDSAPTTLDTLNELALALGEDANFATTITDSIGTKWTQDNTKISNWDSTYTTVESESSVWSSAGTTLSSNGSAPFVMAKDSGGNVRGNNAVDLQLQRSTGVEGLSCVASGIRSALVGGANNAATGDNSIVTGGTGNIASGPDSAVVGGINNTAQGNSAEVIGGSNSFATGTDSTTIGGISLSALGNYSATVGGDKVKIETTARRSGALGGLRNTVSHDMSVILGGQDITTSATNTAYAQNLHITSGFTMPTGASANYVLTTDASGVGTWQEQARDAEIAMACSDEITDLTVGTSKTTFRMPYAMNLTAVRASVNTAPTGGDITVDINESGTTILSTKLTIDDGDKTSVGSSTVAVISDTALADDAEITVDIDTVGSTTAGKGLKIWLIGTKA